MEGEVVEISEPEKRTTELLVDPERFKPKTSESSESETSTVASQSTKEFSEVKEGGRAGGAVLKEVE